MCFFVDIDCYGVLVLEEFGWFVVLEVFFGLGLGLCLLCGLVEGFCGCLFFYLFFRGCWVLGFVENWMWRREFRFEKKVFGLSVNYSLWLDIGWMI